MIPRILNLSIAIALMLTNSAFTAPHIVGGKDKEKVMKSQVAPTFTIKDVYGTTIDLDKLKGKKVMLTLYRNVGCAICNLRFHELQEEGAYFESRNLVLLAVYESTAENMLQYLDDQKVYPKMIPDPELTLYRLYGLEKSMGKMMKALFNGGLQKKKEGKNLFHKKIKRDGSKTRISADFLIDENGVIKEAYYGKYLGDHLPIETIKQFIQ